MRQAESCAHGDWVPCQECVAAITTERNNLAEGLRKHGAHIDECPLSFNTDPPGECTCGLDQLLHSCGFGTKEGK